MNKMEEELLKEPRRLMNLNYLMHSHAFSEIFLAQTVEYYDSWVCLKTQQNLTPSFCFQYLYDNDTDSADNWTDFNDILRYFEKRWPEKTQQEIQNILHKEFEQVLESKKSNMTKDRNVESTGRTA